MSDFFEVSESVKAPRQPQVNLMPPEVGERRNRAKVRVLVAFGFGVFLVLLAGAVAWSEINKRFAVAALEREQERTAQLNAELEKFSEVPIILAELNNGENSRSYLGVFEIDWQGVVDSLDEALPPAISIESLSWSPTTPFGIVGQDGGPYGAPDVGVLSFSGTTTAFVTSAEVTERLDDVTGFDRSQIFTSQRQSEGKFFYKVEGQIRLTADILTLRWSPDWYARQEFVAAIEDAQVRLDSALADRTAAIDALAAIPSEDEDARVAQQGVLDAAELSVTAAQNDLTAAEEALATFELERREASEEPEASADESEQMESEGQN